MALVRVLQNLNKITTNSINFEYFWYLKQAKEADIEKWAEPAFEKG